MKRISLFIVLVSAFVFCNAQPKIKFDKTTYDFGAIHEEAGKVTGRFEFTNVGDSDLVLTNVRPGCGCTPAQYTREAVAPGARGFIDISYNPYNRPGGFHKSIRVTTNEPQFKAEKPASPYVIFVKGEVIKRPPTVFEKAGYTKSSGMARFKNPNIKLEVLNTKSVVDTLQVRNFWTKPVSFTLSSNNTYITEVARSFGNELNPEQEGFIVLKYDASRRGAFGLVRDNVTYTTNDSLEANKRIHLSVNIKEDFSKLSKKERANAPAAVLSTTSVDFGEVQKNSNNSKTFTLTNNGKNPLLVRQLTSSNGYFRVSADKMSIEAGQSATVTVSFKASSRAGNRNATIDVITNDPNNSEQVVNLSAKVM